MPCSRVGTEGDSTLNTDVMFSKKSDNWSTPPDFYKKLDEEFHFDFDPCPLNAQFDGLDFPWYGSIFVNPPYSQIGKFLKKAHEELDKGNAQVIVFLVPARTDTKWFHESVYGLSEIRFIKGRLKFGDGKNSAPFLSLVCVFRRTYS